MRKNLKVVARAFSQSCNYGLRFHRSYRLKLWLCTRLVSCDSSGSGSSCLASSSKTSAMYDLRDFTPLLLPHSTTRVRRPTRRRAGGVCGVRCSGLGVYLSPVFCLLALQASANSIRRRIASERVTSFRAASSSTARIWHGSEYVIGISHLDACSSVLWQVLRPIVRVATKCAAIAK